MCSSVLIFAACLLILVVVVFLFRHRLTLPFIYSFLSVSSIISHIRHCFILYSHSHVKYSSFYVYNIIFIFFNCKILLFIVFSSVHNIVFVSRLFDPCSAFNMVLCFRLFCPCSAHNNVGFSGLCLSLYFSLSLPSFLIY